MRNPSPGIRQNATNPRSPRSLIELALSGLDGAPSFPCDDLYGKLMLSVGAGSYLRFGAFFRTFGILSFHALGALL
jgi:hypothetical protein